MVGLINTIFRMTWLGFQSDSDLRFDTAGGIFIAVHQTLELHFVH